MIEMHEGFKVHRIRSASGVSEAAVVPELGAIVSALRLPAPGGAREVLYQHPHFWDPAAERTRGGIPFLFPVCGRLERDGMGGTYLVNGTLRAMKIHGFAMRGPWQVVKANGGALTVALVDSPATRESFPYAFRVELVFRFEGEAFVIDQLYSNPGHEAFPYYAGFHPYYLTADPGPGKDATILDYRPVRRWVYNSRLTDVCRTEAAAEMPRSVSDPTINEALTEVGADREVRLVHPDGLVLHSRADGVEDAGMFPFVQLYTMTDRPFFCAEPWMGFPNALNTVAGARWLAAGQSERGRLTVWTAHCVK